MTGDESVLGRAAALLDAFDDEHRELALAALVGRSGLPRSTAHRMAAQMVALGWLDKPGGRYRIGNRLFALSGLVPVRHTLREAVLPFLQDLYEATRTTVQLGVLDHDRVLIVEKITGHRRMPMLTQVGGQIPAYCSSLGRAILAHPHRPRRKPGGDRRRAQAGLRVDREEGNAGVSCIGAPIFGPLGEIVAALSVTGPRPWCARTGSLPRCAWRPPPRHVCTSTGAEPPHPAMITVWVRKRPDLAAPRTELAIIPGAGRPPGHGTNVAPTPIPVIHSGTGS
jgi:DNA-binding IclR family transcriptional regulator